MDRDRDYDTKQSRTFARPDHTAREAGPDLNPSNVALAHELA